MAQLTASLPTHQTIRDAATGTLVTIREIEWDADRSSFTVVNPPDLPAGRYTVALTDSRGNPMPVTWN